MKSILGLYLCFFCFLAQSQETRGTWQNQIQGIYNADGSSILLEEDVIEKNERPKYLNSEFQKGKIITIYGEKVKLEKMRFNIYNDYIEFVDGEEVKGLFFGGQVVRAEIGGANLQFIKNEAVQGALIELYSGSNVSIYKKPIVKFIQERPGAGIIGGNAGNYVRSKDKYLIFQNTEERYFMITNKKELKEVYTTYFNDKAPPKKLNDQSIVSFAKRIESIK